MTLIGKKKFDKQFYHAETIKLEVFELTFDYLKNQMALSGATTSDESLKSLNIDFIEDTGLLNIF